MKMKKQKRHRRSVAFFTTCYNFRAPFKILCDGTFIHHLLTNHITPADTAISNILGAPVKLFTTRFDAFIFIMLLQLLSHFAKFKAYMLLDIIH